MRVAKALWLVNAVSLFTAAGLAAAIALPLAPDACSTLDQERHTLESSGVLDDVRATPDTAKVLPKDRLDRVERYVEVSSLILFRCAPAVAAVPVQVPGTSRSAVGGSAAAQKTSSGKKKSTAN